MSGVRLFCELQQTLWNMKSPEERDAEYWRERDKRDRLIADINRDFAIVTDGPRAGQIVSVLNGKRVSKSTINALHIKDQGIPVVNIWLMDERRRQMGSDELRNITAKKSSES